MRNRLTALAILATLGATAAQATLVVPTGFNNTEGNSNNAFPWNWPNSPIRTQFIYDSSNFTGQSVNMPVAITRLRFRADASGGSWSGGTYGSAVIQLSTCPVDCLALSTTFAANHGGDLTTVFSGPLTVAGGNAPTPGPGPWHIDIPLATPFLYTPANGDITVDITVSGFSGGSLTQSDHHGPGGPLCSRLYDLSGTSPTGNFDLQYGAICEFTYSLGAGYATSSRYGQGCYDGKSSFYELFQPSTFDLGGSGSAINSIMMIPNGGGYTVLPGQGQWFTPTSPSLGLTDDSVSTPPFVLPFPLPTPAGLATSITMSSNGFVWTGSNGGHGCCGGSSSGLLTDTERFAIQWGDLNPGLGGTTHLDIDPSGAAVYATWLNVPEYGTSNLNTLQIAFFAGGMVEYRYQACAVTNHTTLTGWSQGNGALDPGSIDLSSAIPFATTVDGRGLALDASARPVLGTSINLVTSLIPNGTNAGLMLISLQQFNPGVDLTPVGLPGCFQYAGLGAANFFLTSGASHSLPVGLPNTARLAGQNFYAQSLTLSGGYNAFGAVTSNGVMLHLDVN